MEAHVDTYYKCYKIYELLLPLHKTSVQRISLVAVNSELDPK